MIGYYKTNDETVRVAVDYDSHADHPLDFQDVSVYVLEVNRFYDVKNFTNPLGGEIDEAIDNSDEEWATVYEPSTDQRREFVEKFLTERNIPFYTTTVMAGRDWVFTGVFYSSGDGMTAEIIRKFIPELNAWYNGEVYRITLQKENVYRNIDDPEDFIIKWNYFEADDFYSYGNIYDFDDVKSIVDDATEYVLVGDLEWRE